MHPQIQKMIRLFRAIWDKYVHCVHVSNSQFKDQIRRRRRSR
jgi:hypothetical protein